MKIAILGLGYVGLSNLAFLANETRSKVVGFDVDETKIAALKKRQYYLDEPGLNQALKGLKDLPYTSSLDEIKDADAYFLCVGTPEKEDGSADLSALFVAVDSLKGASSKKAYLVIRSTVPVGTANSVKERLKDAANPFIVISYPEFLAESRAYEDEAKPARFVVGCSDKDGFDFIENLRKKSISEGIPFYPMSNESAELTKYASNIFLSLKISYINELARYAEVAGANINDVALAMGADPRIGHSMLKAGVGYGGSCFPKDSKALIQSAAKEGVTLLLPEAANAVNLTQPLYFYKKILSSLPNSHGTTIALLGLSYKAGTSDIRNSIALKLASYLLEAGYTLKGYDPSELARQAFGAAMPKLTVVSSLEEAVKDADALLLLTEDFADLDETFLLKAMRGRYLFDGRNLYSVNHFKYFRYLSVGRKDGLPHVR
jgi:UDPglucose 6-dehydrogenase